MSLKHYADQPHQLKEIVQSAINRNGYFAFSRVSADIQDDNIVLTGTVETYYQKQLAQETVRKIAGTTLINNQIQVGTNLQMDIVKT